MKQREGITLIEVIVTVAIVGVLLAILVPAIINYQKHSDTHITAWIEMSENETIEVEVDRYIQSDDTITIYTEDGTRYVVHSSKVIIQEEQRG